MTTGTGSPYKCPSVGQKEGKARGGRPRVGAEVEEAVLGLVSEGASAKVISMGLGLAGVRVTPSTVRRIIKKAAPAVGGQEDDGDES